MKKRDKRGQELSIGTLVLIVLGIIVLVLLILGFSIGWESLFSKIGIFQGNDLASVVTACNLATSSSSQTSYCEFKKAKINGVSQYVNCEDSRVADELESKLEACNTNIIEAECIKVAKAEKITTTIGKDSYNGQSCYDVLKFAMDPSPVNCDSITRKTKDGKTISAEAKDASCPAEKVNVAYLIEKKDKKCCIAVE